MGSRRVVLRWVKLGLASIVLLGADRCGCAPFGPDDTALAGAESQLPRPIIVTPEQGASFTPADTVFVSIRMTNDADAWLFRWSVKNMSLVSITPDVSGDTTGTYFPGSLPPGDYSLLASGQFRLPSGTLHDGRDTVTFTVTPSSNQLPDVSIVWPADGTEWPADSALTFMGSAQDAEDGALSGSSLVWTSSLDGVLGTGMMLAHPGISEGDHLITLTATDTGGGVGSRTTALHSRGPATAIQGLVTLGGVPRASVVMELSGSASRFTSTAPNGRYLFADLEPGDYVVRVHPPAGTTFAPVTQSVSILVGQVLEVDFAGS